MKSFYSDPKYAKYVENPVILHRQNLPGSGLIDLVRIDRA